MQRLNGAGANKYNQPQLDVLRFLAEQKKQCTSKRNWLTPHNGSGNQRK